MRRGNEEIVSFEYNEEGLRTKKTARSTGETEYILHGKNITHMTQGSHTLHFYYDAQGKPGIVIYDGTAYGYLYNLQGDVVALVNGSGTKVVEYTYDAWGMPTGKTGTMAGTLGTVQPFRYRGYVWDEETGLYYLRSRYYRAEWCRFLSADALINGNLYIYASNNPIIYIDENGYDTTYSLAGTTALHNVVVELVRAIVKGTTIRAETGILGAGPHGGYGYPDVIDSEKRAWEIKFNNTSYGLRSGTAQENRYTNGTGFSPGYPVYIEPFDYVLDGIQGKVTVNNGSIETGDAGVVYYEFIPKPRTVPVYEFEPAYETEKEHNFGKSVLTIGAYALVAVTMFTPVWGDEEVALGLLMLVAN
ncbi:MAG: RHS repeat-associated core domain-containing protein [Clostridia bacterium]|nr:RHS repeat-associated core domain-containing protein [Clostridia bacterium]